MAAQFVLSSFAEVLNQGEKLIGRLPILRIRKAHFELHRDDFGPVRLCGRGLGDRQGNLYPIHGW